MRYVGLDPGSRRLACVAFDDTPPITHLDAATFPIDGADLDACMVPIEAGIADNAPGRVVIEWGPAYTPAPPANPTPADLRQYQAKVTAIMQSRGVMERVVDRARTFCRARGIEVAIIGPNSARARIGVARRERRIGPMPVEWAPVSTDALVREAVVRHIGAVAEMLADADQVDAFAAAYAVAMGPRVAARAKAVRDPNAPPRVRVPPPPPPVDLDGLAPLVALVTREVARRGMAMRHRTIVRALGCTVDRAKDLLERALAHGLLVRVAVGEYAPPGWAEP